MPPVYTPFPQFTPPSPSLHPLPPVYPTPSVGGGGGLKSLRGRRDDVEAFPQNLQNFEEKKSNLVLKLK